ncbi:hypothetical protein HHI36_020865 [Cryptolaemus montrouzieri]|uniref:Uncharacterized protein n=1 Tax=Cryptolaemus montrouzieri TaxID=559131 RepID=A0ABD2ND85_9CUCU
MGDIHRLGSCSRLILKVLLVLWILAVVVECSDLTKRDVVHRIVLKSGRKPRSQKHHYQNSGRGHSTRGHKHGHRDRDKSREFDDTKYDSHEDSRESRRNRSPEDSRENRNSNRDSRENSYENSFENVRSQKERPSRQKHHRYHRLNDDFEVEESRISEGKIRVSTEDDWASTPKDVPPPPKTANKKSKKYRTPIIDLTTSFPVKPPQYSAYEPLYPPLPALPALQVFPTTFQYNHQTEISEIQPQFPVLQPKPVNTFTNFLPLQGTPSGFRNFSNNYEVHETEILVQPTKSFSTSTAPFQKIKATNPTHSPNFVYSTSTNVGLLGKNDIKKLLTTRTNKKRVKTKV